MALIKCIDCGKEYSNQAPACLHCGNPIQSPRDAAIEIHKTYGELIRKIGGDIQTARISQIADYKETIRNLILTNGAIAAFSLPLLSNSEILKIPLILGVFFLLTNMVIAYIHLQRGWTKAFKTFNENEKVLLTPAKEITDLATEVIRGKKQIRDLIVKDGEFKELGGQYDQLSDYLSDVSLESHKLNHTDDALIMLFILALICIAYSLVSKPLDNLLINIFQYIY